MKDQQGIALPIVLLIITLLMIGMQLSMKSVFLQYQLSQYQYRRWQHEEILEEWIKTHYNDVINISACQLVNLNDRWLTEQTNQWWQQISVCTQLIKQQMLFFRVINLKNDSCDSLNGNFVSYKKIIIHTEQPVKLTMGCIIATPTLQTSCLIPRQILHQPIQSLWFFEKF